jgi:hypothetical protein
MPITFYKVLNRNLLIQKIHTGKKFVVISIIKKTLIYHHIEKVILSLLFQGAFLYTVLAIFMLMQVFFVLALSTNIFLSYTKQYWKITIFTHNLFLTGWLCCRCCSNSRPELSPRLTEKKCATRVPSCRWKFFAQVWAGNEDDCRDVTWEECNPVLKQVTLFWLFLFI